MIETYHRREGSVFLVKKGREFLEDKDGLEGLLATEKINE